ncbi:MAG: hypothetical protein A3F91_07085 [Flavobacteria bacterium RIFCSPLOWO2_12_FULL_35_11]|nr:MAG: hypothetical protein A3F91_07085 [Flavobacteria bacterium RIFCSPLOWO2_12_FULL_35_11]
MFAMKKNDTYILKLILAYISQDLSEKEFNELKDWLNDDPENTKLFSEYLYFYKKSRRIGFTENVDSNHAWNNINTKLHQEPNIVPILEKPISKLRFLRQGIRFIKYAAVFIGVIGIGYYFMNQHKTTAVSGNQLQIADDKITLELENGNVKVIQTGGKQQRINISGKVVAEQIGNILNYEKENSAEELAYNILTIPNGKKFQVVLSDGTEVHLNSGSVLKYPVKFITGINRQVYLLEGEAYFDVAKDPKHPFIVNADDINIRVLGTEFNVSTYPEDSSINTVLVEGAVSIFGKDKTYDKATSLELKPGYMASWDKTKNNATIDEVDTNIYTGWKNGKLIFKNIQFKNIIKKLERHYNVTIINNNSKLDEKNYDATFDVETIEEVLNSFNKNYEIEYTIENNKIIIN